MPETDSSVLKAYPFEMSESCNTRRYSVQLYVLRESFSLITWACKSCLIRCLRILAAIIQYLPDWLGLHVLSLHVALGSSKGWDEKHLLCSDSVS